MSTRNPFRNALRSESLADRASFLRAMALANVKESLDSDRKNDHLGKDSLLYDLARRCTEALRRGRAHPSTGGPTFRYDDGAHRDTPRTFARLVEDTAKGSDILADAEELASTWACFFQLYGPKLHGKVFRGSFQQNDHGMSGDGPFERVGVAVTSDGKGLCLAYVVLGHEDAFTPWFYYTHCISSLNLSTVVRGACAFDPLVLAGGHGRPVDPSTYGSNATEIAWLT